MARLVANFKNKSFTRAFIWAFVLLAVALVINYYAGMYATEKASNPVTDVILNNIPVFDVDEFFVYGAYLLIACIFWAGFTKTHRIPFIVKSISLLFIIRSVFVTLTHIAPFPTHAIIDPLSLMRFFDFSGDLFFSGHVALPFLMALVFWDSKFFRTVFICFSIVLGAVVLMGHLHYSIDVFAAFFITYAIYGIACQLFKSDKAMGEALDFLA